MYVFYFLEDVNIPQQFQQFLNSTRTNFVNRIRISGYTLRTGRTFLDVLGVK